MSSLETRDLVVILSELKEVAIKWRYIGLACGMDDNDLDVIDRSNPEIMEKLRKVVRQLINNGCSWEALCDAVSNPLVGNVKLAEKIRKKYVQGRTSYAVEKSNTSGIHDEASVNKDTDIGQETVNSPLQPLSPGGTHAFPALQSPTKPLTSPFSSHWHSPRGESESQLPKHEEQFHSFTPGRVASSKPQTESEIESRSMVESEISLHSQVLEHETPMIISPEASLQMNQEVGENVAEVCQDRLSGPKEEDHVHANTCIYTMGAESATSIECVQTEFQHEKTSSTTSPDVPHVDTMPIKPPLVSGRQTHSRELCFREGYELRGYQKELAGPGLRGENCIIVAPTGSGKTLVAGYIIMTHLNKMKKEAKKPKVVFITPTQQLTYQQNKKVKNYIPELRSVEITGGSKAPMVPLVENDDIDVIVSTGGMLRREMKTEKVFITDFSLIILDECHHASHFSHYSDIMEFYIRKKLSKSSEPLPQVIGLTASPGAGKGNSTKEAIRDHLSSLCAVLDASTGFVKVKKHMFELELLHGPNTYLEVNDARPPDDPFFSCIYEAMKNLEQKIGGPTAPVKKCSSRYEGWLKAEKSAAEGSSEDQRERISVLEQLQVYYKAVVTYNNFRYEDAIAVLNEISDFRNPTNFDLSLSQIHKQLMKKLKLVPNQPNPLQIRMENILKDTIFAQNPESRGIFFVCSIQHTEYVTNWIKTSSSLSCLIRAAPITGHSRGGMDKQEQVHVLKAFQEGTYNLLASTSVLEEGLDVAECNFVIRYQHIPNEIAQVQAKGRARAPDSRIYTVISANSNKRYQYFLMEEMHQLVTSSLSDVSLDLLPRQQSFLEDRDRKAQEIGMFQDRWSDAEKVEIRCKKCKVLACKGSDVFYCLSNDCCPHYAVPDHSFSDMYEKEIHNKPETSADFSNPFHIFCCQEGCRNKWGVISRWGDTGYEFPLLKCGSFLFIYGNETQRFKQWKKIWFNVQNIRDLDEFENEVKQY